MKIKIKHLRHAPSSSLIDLIKSELEGFQPALQIDEARVQVERRLEQSPPFHVSFHLVTPGPDVFAEAADYTLRAALLKAFAIIGDKIGHRQHKRARRKDVQTVTTSGRRFTGNGSPR